MKRKVIIFLILFLLNLFLPKISLASVNDLVISEIMYDAQGSDSGQEWIEIYNGGTETVEVLTGSGNQTWRFWDGSNHLLNLVNGTSTIASNEYFIIASDANQFLASHPGFTAAVFDTVMSLPNTSSTIALSFDGGQNQNISAHYDSAWGATGDGNTLEKIILNQDSGGSNWQVSSTSGGTPGQINSQPADIPPNDGGDGNPPGDDENPPENDEDNPPSQQGSGGSSNNWNQVKISEFLPNPSGSDEGEWIELFNTANVSIDLSGCKLQDNSARVFTLAEDANLNFNISANSYLLLSKSLTGISLNNTGGDSVKFYDPNNNLIESISYLDSAPENKSYARLNNDFVWTAALSPGANNIIETNLAPQAKILILSKDLIAGQKIILSAEESSDPEEGSLKYFWDFGDDITADEKKENHIYASAGKYLVSLKVTDAGGLSSEATSLLDVQSLDPEIKLQDIAKIDFQPSDLLISEFLADPIGSDEEEWIELYNASNKNINLSAWQLDDDEGGSKPYLFNASSSIASGEFLLISRQESKLALNNQADAVRLITPLGEVWQKVDYQQAKEGESQAWDLVNQEWFLAKNPSPQSPNLQVTNASEIIISRDNWQDKQLVSFSGLALSPSSTSSRSLFLAPLNNNIPDYENVIEIYNNKKEWPQILAGDLVVVNGQVNNKYQPLRIKIKNKDDLQLIGDRIDLIVPETIELSDFSENDLGSYMSLHAWVVKKSGSNIYLAEEKDGEIKVRVALNFSTKDLNLKKDTEIIASGVLGLTDEQFKLTVLRAQDLKLSQTVLGEKIDTQLSTSTNSIENSLVRRLATRNFLLYFILIVVIFLAFLFLKQHKK